MNIRCNRNKEGLLEIKCNEMEKWEDGDKLVRYLRKKFGAKVMEKVEGPDSRSWLIVVNGAKLSVNQWDLGFLSILSAGSDSDEVILQIADQLQNIPSNLL